MSERMIGFHVDMNVGQFTRGYLEHWLRYLADAGYNTIIWEVENNVRWETVPECVSPDAFSKEEFGEILALSRSLGLEPIPLLQTIGHAEYVLKHEPYVPLRELPDRIEQYCPLHPEVLPLLRRWVGEYLEVFGDVKRFHLGADEAWHLGACPKCSAFAAARSKSDLYIEHINAVSAPLRERGITPIIWCDMALKHPEALDKLSRDILIFDWMYDIRADQSWAWVWGKGRVEADRLDAATRERFGRFLFPKGEGKGLNVFYATDYLRAEGFHAVTCPGASSYGDNVFTPWESKHEPNTWDFGGKGLADADGTVLTSWSVHLHPWELQKACIDMPGYRAAHPEATLADFRDDFTRRTFGVAVPEFFDAVLNLEVRCPYSYTSSLGYNKSCPKTPLEYVGNDVAAKVVAGKGEENVKTAEEALASYEAGREIIVRLRGKATSGREYLDAWLLAADTLVHRARAAIYLFTRALGNPRGDSHALLRELEGIEARMREEYLPIHRPTRRKEMMAWMFASLRYALAQGL